MTFWKKNLLEDNESGIVIHPKTYRKLRRDIDKDTDEYRKKALDFVIKYLDWNYNKEYEMRLKKLDRQKFSEYHPIDRLAGQIEAEGNNAKAHIIHFNWEKMTNTENKAFVLEFAYCLIHEILEIYLKQTGIRLVHLPPNEDAPTEKEMEIMHRFSEDVLGIPKEEWNEYVWKDT